MANQTPISNRVHIGIFGNTNSGKSTLINAITNQNIALVSDIKGTTTDPVYKTMEILPIGPVVIIDTAGFNDTTELGNLRKEKTLEVLRKTDIAVLVINSQDGITDDDKFFIKDIKAKNIPLIIVFNKSDICKPNENDIDFVNKNEIPYEIVSSKNKTNINELKEKIASLQNIEKEMNLVEGLVEEGDIAILVVPIDSAAPKGRLILPQQQTIRAILEKGAIAMVTKETELIKTLNSLSQKPKIVITDSQAFFRVKKDVPEDIYLTSFSIIFARFKGELNQLLDGAKAIENLKPNSKVLIVEGCTHHRQKDDIGTVKIPKWLNEKVNGEIKYEFVSGTEFPQNLNKYDLIVHCGACMLNKKEMQYRLKYAKENGAKITNYGMLIAYLEGILKRALEPFK